MLIRRALVPLLVVLALVAAAPPAGAAQERTGHERRKAIDSVTITSVGWGHGRGLSQYGARNRAQAGQGWKKIVRHYYPGTTIGKAGGRVRILLTADTTKDVKVRARSGLKLRSLGAKRTWRLPAKVRGNRVSAWRIQPAGHRSKVQYRTGRWHTWRTPKGDAEFTAGGRPIVLQVPGARTAYRGSLRSVSTNASGRQRDTVNVLSLESYLRGVVAREVPASWPRHAVRAQAVAARTYAAFERRDSKRDYYDLCDTSSCQVYAGVAGEHSLANRAIRATKRRVVTYGGRPAFAQFSASNGGWSVAGQFPYLRAAKDPFDKGAAGDPTSADYPADLITRNWSDLGDLVSIEVTERDGHGRFGGRVLEVTVEGTKHTYHPSGAQLASWLGLRSTLFTIS